MTLSSTARQIIFWLLIIAGAVLLYRLVNPGGSKTQPMDLTALYQKIDKGEISKVFETQFGLHLVQCLDKKAPAPPNFELAKPRIESYLRQQALGTELQNRLKRNRETAIIVRNYDYVEPKAAKEEKKTGA